MRPAFVLILLLPAILLVSRGEEATPTAFSCPVTIPTTDRPGENSTPFDSQDALHHENGIWVTIPEDGVIELGLEDALTFGPLEGWRSQTVTWLRDEGVEGFIEVFGQRLDAESEFSPQTPLSPQRQYVRIGFVQTGLAFPSEGCWQVTGTVGDASISWVVEVRFLAEIVATPAS